MNRFEIAVIGDVYVGKDTFIKRHITGEFTVDYNASIRTVNYELPFNTQYGKIYLDIVVYPGGCTSVSSTTNAIIAMFDLTSVETYKNVDRYCNNTYIPIVLCGNKCDLRDRKVNVRMITLPMRKNIKYYDISAKSNYNFEKPFLYLIRELTHIQDIQFIEIDEDDRVLKRHIDLEKSNPSRIHI